MMEMETVAPLNDMPEVTPDLIERFGGYFVRGAPDECWEWTGPRNGSDALHSYGRICYRGQKYIASRLAWHIEYGGLGRRELVLHRCDNPPCVNPNHLFVGTHVDNALDAFNKGRAVVYVPGATHPNARLSEGAVREIRRSSLNNYQLGKRFGVDPSAIRQVRIGRTWSHVQ